MSSLFAQLANSAAGPTGPTAGSTTDITIQAEMSRLDSAQNAYPATDLVKELIKFHKTEDPQRDVFLFSQLIHRAARAYFAINGVIHNIQTSTLEVLDWNQFEKYTTAIPSLERILLEFYLKRPQEGEQRKHVPDYVDDVASGVAFISLWEQDRNVVTRGLEALKSNDFLTLGKEAKALEADYREELRKDDDTTIRALVNYIQAYGPTKLKDTHIPERGRTTPVSNVRTGMRIIGEKRLDKPHHPGFYQLVVKSFMLLIVPFALLDSTRPRERRVQADVREHLTSMKVWDSMNALINLISSVFDTKAGPTDDVIDNLTKAYVALERLLLETCRHPVGTLKELLQLIKLPAQIRRPFHGRSNALVKILRLLDEQSADADAESRRQLRDLMRDTITALEHTSGVVPSVTTFLMSSPEYNSEDNALKALLDRAETSSTALKLTKGWNEKAALFNEGKRIDETHLREMRRVFMGEQ